MFTINTFTNTTLSGNGNPFFHLYSTEDKQADLLVAGYFNDLYNFVNKLDIIIATTDLAEDESTRKVTCFAVTKVENGVVTVAKGTELYVPAAAPTVMSKK